MSQMMAAYGGRSRITLACHAGSFQGHLSPKPVPVVSQTHAGYAVCHNTAEDPLGPYGALRRRQGGKGETLWIDGQYGGASFDHLAKV